MEQCFVDRHTTTRSDALKVGKSRGRRSKFRGDCRVGMKRGQTDSCRVVRPDGVAGFHRSITATERSFAVQRRRRLVSEADRLAAAAAGGNPADVPTQVPGLSCRRRLRSPWQ